MQNESNPFAKWAELTVSLMLEMDPERYRQLRADREKVEDEITLARNAWVAEQMKIRQ